MQLAEPQLAAFSGHRGSDAGYRNEERKRTVPYAYRELGLGWPRHLRSRQQDSRRTKTRADESSCLRYPEGAVRNKTRRMGLPVEASKVWTSHDDGEQVPASEKESRGFQRILFITAGGTLTGREF